MLKEFLNKKNTLIFILLSLLLVGCIVFITVLSVSLAKREQGENGSVNSNGSSNSSEVLNQLANPGTYEEVEYAAMPTDLNGVTLSRDELVSKYRGHTDWRIYSIRTTKDEIKPAEGGTAYYVSNKGLSSNDGLTPETPLRNLSDLGKIKRQLKEGDVVYFERGSIFRGQLIADVPGVTYAAYGEGKKPEFYASPGDASEWGTWEPVSENPNVYKYSMDYPGRDIGTIVFNGGEKHGIKCVIRTEDDGTTYDNTTDEPFNTYADITKNLHFYHDYKVSGSVYLYCKDGNPGEVFDSIEFCIKQHIISVQADNVHFDNLCLKYGGAHGISSGTRTGLTITNCEFGWIGGSIQADGIFGRNYATRYGNAVEIYGGCDDYNIKNCYFYQIYDAAVTFQYSTTGDSSIVMKNVNFSNNVMEYCNYSVEYFLSGGTNATSYIENVKITDNLMWYTGTGLCAQRPDKRCDAHIKSWQHTNTRRGTFEINNNLFAISKSCLIQSNAKKASHSPDYDGNTYIQYLDKGSLGQSGNEDKWIRFKSDVMNDIKSMLGDNNAKVIFVK